MKEQSEGSVTGWIRDLKSKDPVAQAKIWERFVRRLVGLANRKLSNGRCSLVDADDIASMAFSNLFAKTPDYFETLANRNELWRILALLVERRVVDEIRKATTQKQGGGRLVSESMLGNQHGQSLGLDSFPNRSMSPEFDVMLAEELEKCLDSLDDNLLRQIAIEKMQGSRNREIASKLSISLRSVERKLGEIRSVFASLT